MGKVKIAIDAGHGIHTPGKRTPDGEHEWSFNNKVVGAVIDELNTYLNVEVLRTDDPTGRIDVPLSTRTNKANAFKADALVSVHHNALKGSYGTWTGSETFIMSPSSENPKSLALAKSVHPYVVQAMGLQDRGIKSANFYVLRETNMPAILTEAGYMDSSIDVKVMRDDNVLKAQGKGIAKGLAKHFHLSKKAEVKLVSKPKPAIRYTDVGTNVKAYSAIESLSKLGIVNGYVDGTFKPSESITRGEMAILLDRLYKAIKG